MATIIQLRNDTAANFTQYNPTLAEGEIGLELDTKKIKVGDGIHTWNQLDYWTDASLIEKAVKYNGSTAIGSATQGVYVAADGTATAMTYELNKTVPSDAVFTDTTYSDFVGATGSAAGTSGLVPAPTATDNEKFLKGDGTWEDVTVPTKISDLTDDTSTYPIDKADTLTGLTATVTELNYTDGVTSNIQTQLDGKVDENAAITGATKCKITYDSKGLVTAGDDLTASDIPDLSLSKITDVTATAAEVNILDGATLTTTELNYVDGVTSNIQDQLNELDLTKQDAFDTVLPLELGTQTTGEPHNYTITGTTVTADLANSGYMQEHFVGTSGDYVIFKNDDYTSYNPSFTDVTFDAMWGYNMAYIEIPLNYGQLIDDYVGGETSSINAHVIMSEGSSVYVDCLWVLGEKLNGVFNPIVVTNGTVNNSDNNERHFLCDPEVAQINKPYIYYPKEWEGYGRGSSSTSGNYRRLSLITSGSSYIIQAYTSNTGQAAWRNMDIPASHASLLSRINCARCYATESNKNNVPSWNTSKVSNTATGWTLADGIQTSYNMRLNYDDSTIKVNGSNQLYVYGKQDTLVSGTNIKTINNSSILGSGNLDIDALPSQSGQSGKFLTTDGTSASWATVDALPTQTGQSGKFLTTDGSSASWASALTSSDVINAVNSTATDQPLSANMGKELQEQITHLQGIGRFLALWDCSTGLAETNPPVSPYTYKTGDYFIVGTVATGSGTNYKPSGSSYITGTASTTVETETVRVGYVYYYDGTTWRLQPNEAGTVTDVQVAGTSVVTSGVANIPVATNNDLGVVRGNAATGLSMNANGYFLIQKATDNDLVSKISVYKPVVPNNIDKAVMEGLGNSSLTWTDEYKESARNTISATQAVFVDWSE